MNSRQRAILTSIGVILGDFPESIGLAYTPPKLVMKLKKEAAGFSKHINMQDTRACFEAWCLVIKAKTSNPGLKIELDVDGITIASYLGGKPANGHLGRFLYRILKFSEQYKYWFELSSTLEVLKDNFKNYLALPGVTFVTSAPGNEASDNLDDLKNNLESYIEYVFWDSYRAQRDILKLDRGAIVGRQLPVSLFEGSSVTGNEVFTRQKSAIDFWAVDRGIINVYELKVNNPMVGIITEIFFYSNYVHDVFIAGYLNHTKGKVSHKTDVQLRNYDKITGKKVHGIMISNRRDDDKGWHSSLDELTRRKITDIMNTNGTAGIIQYTFLKYNFKMSITVTP